MNPKPSHRNATAPKTTHELRTLKCNSFSSIVALFASSGTLICCALPALLVAIGAGAAMSSLVTNIPQLVWFSTHKFAVFLCAGIMLTISGVMQWRAKSLPCPADPALAVQCMRTRLWSIKLYLASVAIFIIGGFFAFIAPVLYLSA